MMIQREISNVLVLSGNYRKFIRILTSPLMVEARAQRHRRLAACTPDRLNWDRHKITKTRSEERHSR